MVYRKYNKYSKKKGGRRFYRRGRVKKGTKKVVKVITYYR